VSSELTVVSSSDELETLKEDWTRLSVFGEHNWELYWDQIRHQTPSPTPYVVAIRRDGHLRAALTGRLEASSVSLQVGYSKLLTIPVRRIVFPIHGLLGSDDEARSMVEKVAEDLRHGRADLAVFQFVEEDSPVHRAIRDAALDGRMRDRSPERVIHRYLMLPSTFDEYLRKHKGLVAKLKKFEKAFRDRYEYRLLTREDEIDGFCDGADGVARTSYQRALGVGFLNSAEDRGRMTAAARQGAWRGFVLQIDGKTAAFWSGSQFGSTFSVWWTSFDMAFQAYSPGLVASIRMTEAFMQCGVTVVDFGPGDAPYKERLATEFRWEETVCVYAPSFRGSLARGVRAADMAVSNLAQTRLKRLANWVKTPWRRILARRMSHLESGALPKEVSRGE
jgi:CelD/BcsL family acetyltransferase involved in cellulose biosynthesis